MDAKDLQDQLAKQGYIMQAPIEGVPPMLQRADQVPPPGGISSMLPVADKYMAPLDFSGPKPPPVASPNRPFTDKEIIANEAANARAIPAGLRPGGPRGDINTDLSGMREPSGGEAPKGPPGIVTYQPPPSGPPMLPMMGGGPVRRDMMTTARQIERGAEMTSEARAASQNYLQAGQRLAADQATQADLDARVEAANRRAEASSEFYGRKTMSDLDIKQKNEMNRALGNKDAAKSAYESAPSSIRDAFSKADTGGKVIMAIGMIFGSIGAAFGNGRNSFIDVANGAIESDLGKKAKLLSLSEDAIGKLSAQQKEERDQALKAKGDRLAAMKAQIAATAAANPDNRAGQIRADQITMALNKEIVGVEEQLAKTYGGRTVEHQSLVTTGGGGVAAPKSDMSLYVPGAGGNATTAEGAREANKKNEGLDIQEKNMSKIASLRSEGAQYTTEGRAQLEALKNETFVAWCVTNGVRPSPKTEAIFEHSIGNVSSIVPNGTPFLGGTDTRIKVFQENLAAQRASVNKNVGVAQSQAGYARAANGQVVRTNALTGQDYTPPPKAPTRSFEDAADEE